METPRPLTPLKSVRAYCLWCCRTSPEVKLCPSDTCALWPYRLGHNPKTAQTGLTATYEVDEAMTARKAIFARCLDCYQKKTGDCKAPDCQLHHIRYPKSAVSRRSGRSARPLSGAALAAQVRSRAGGISDDKATEE